MNIEDIGDALLKGQNFMGIETQIAIILECEVTSIPDIAPYDSLAPELAHTITADLTLNAGAGFASFVFRKKEAQYKAEDTGEEDARSVTVNGSFYIPEITPFKTYVTNVIGNQKCIVLLWDRNNPNPRLLGEKGNGVMLKVTEQTNPKNGYLFEIVGENLDQKPPFYAGAIAYAT